VITIVRKNLSGTELTFGVREHPLAYSCKGGEKVTLFSACCVHTFKCDFAPDFICDRLEVYHAAANKLINSRYLLPALAEINYLATPLSYNFNNIGKYVDFFAYYPYCDGFRAIIWKSIWVIPITIRVI
jgi:hypothetical protein